MGDESLDARLTAKRPTVVQERHGNEVVAKHEALYAHQREHAHQPPIRVARGEVNALVPESAPHDRAPSEQVEMGPLRLGAHERIPPCRRAPDRFYEPRPG